MTPICPAMRRDMVLTPRLVADLLAITKRRLMIAESDATTLVHPGDRKRAQDKARGLGWRVARLEDELGTKRPA